LKSGISHQLHGRDYLAIACVCFFWGTTYVGIRIAVESLTPAMLMCLRYVASGGVLMIAAWIKGARMPAHRELLLTALYGVITIGVGTGCLAYSEQWIPSGLAALMVCTQPFWIVGIEALRTGGERLHLATVAGMLIGFSGVALLVAPVLFGGGNAFALDRVSLLSGFFVLQFGGVAWSIGSLGQRRLARGTHPIVSGAIQQLAAGLAFAPVALLDPRPNRWTMEGIAATAYLAVFGGIIGYSAYIYTMVRLPIALASIYNYVNPVVAVLLGALFLSERLTGTVFVAMAVILVGVFIVKQASRHAPGPRPARMAAE
jgi:drug/metabolite transporter (DMT)-like permease